MKYVKRPDTVEAFHYDGTPGQLIPLREWLTTQRIKHFRRNPNDPGYDVQIVNYEKYSIVEIEPRTLGHEVIFIVEGSEQYVVTTEDYFEVCSTSSFDEEYVVAPNTLQVD